MSFNNLEQSLEEAAKRLGRLLPPRSTRSRRSDRGRSRLPAPVSGQLQALLSTTERPPIRALITELEKFCRETGCRIPARATLYAFMANMATPSYVPAQLPRPVQDTLYNLDLSVPVPGHQLAFYCFNYGDLAAVSYAAGLPWLALYQASRMRGYRPKSRGLLDAVLRARGI